MNNIDCWKTVPQYVRAHIYCNLSIKDKFNFMLACKAFNNDINSEYQWRLASEKSYPQAIKAESLSWKEHFKNMHGEKWMVEMVKTNQFVVVKTLEAPLCYQTALIGDSLYMAQDGGSIDEYNCQEGRFYDIEGSGYIIGDKFIKIVEEENFEFIRENNELQMEDSAEEQLVDVYAQGRCEVFCLHTSEKVLDLKTRRMIEDCTLHDGKQYLYVQEGDSGLFTRIALGQDAVVDLNDPNSCFDQVKLGKYPALRGPNLCCDEEKIVIMEQGEVIIDYFASANTKPKYQGGVDHELGYTVIEESEVAGAHKFIMMNSTRVLALYNNLFDGRAKIGICDLEKNTVLHVWELEDCHVTAMAFWHGIVLAGTEQGEILFLDRDSKDPYGSLQTGVRVWKISVNGKRIVSQSDFQIMIWEVKK